MLETTADLFARRVTSKEQLEEIIGTPRELVRRKQMPALDEGCREFITHSPFLLISTSNSEGTCDVSPRGDAPGFVMIVDDTHLVIPERPGNRRADTLTNIIANPHVGLLFLIPTVEETLRVNGRACVFADPAVLEKLAFQGKVPLLAIGIEIEEVYMHCAKAFKRSHLWEKESWPESRPVKTLGQLLVNQVKMPNMTAEDIDCSVEEGYRTRLY